MKHPAPQFRIGCLERNIDRFQPVSDNSLNIMVVHVGQRHVIALKKRQTGIVILKIQSIPHSFRHLVDETEHTFISAGAVLIHETFPELHSQFFICIFFNFQLPLLAVRFLDQEQNLLVFRIKLIIKNIFNFMSVDR